MLYFDSDYNNGAHPKILERLTETNPDRQSGYGKDIYTESAIARIRDACKCPEADVFLTVGGTQTNQLVISTMLKPYEGVIAARTGHISLHESGAIEYSGHKVIELECHDGLLDAQTIDDYVTGFYHDESQEHMVFPGMVYISFPTEYGTVYTHDDLEKIHKVCRKFNMTLYIDGARLGYGLCSRQNDITLPELTGLCDVFYIGATKVGGLCGEAIVFTHGNMPQHFEGQSKQHGALLAKGRLLGVQFDTLFTDGLYFDISRHTVGMAEKLKAVFAEKGYRFFIDSPTNQQFIIMDNAKLEELKNEVRFSCWEKYDEDHTVVRFCTGWSTGDEDIEALGALL